MSRRLSLFLFLVLITIAAWSLDSNALESRQTVTVGLVRLEDTPIDSAVRLEWDTETELGTAGYKVKRGQNNALAYLATPGGSSLPASEIQDAETGALGGSLAGKIYLWTAFIAALVIFVVAVIGAILIYTRQRSKE